jgi:4-amino-4-deoxy-L-arabinose transferase-like glycosyltransferase
MGKTLADLIRRRPLALLFLICLIAWVPGFFTIPPLDRDESRFAQSSKQMLESGDLLDIRFGVEPRYKKPVGIYWLQAAATEAVDAVTGDHARDHIWTYRIPSLLGALAAVMLAYWCASAFLGAEASFLSALLLGLTLLLSAESKIAKTDAVLLATILGAQGVLLRAYLARGSGHPAPSFRLAMLGWLSFSIGILIKGPVIAGVVGFTALALVICESNWRWMARAAVAAVAAIIVLVLLKQFLATAIPGVALLAMAVRYGDWRWLGSLRPGRGLLLTLVLTVPWLVTIFFISHGAFYQQSLGHDFGAKLMGGEESHGAPPGYYLLIVAVSFWPATLFLLPALALTIMRHREPAARFLLAWAGTWWLIEFVPTKLPNYILPAYPALAMMAAAFALAPREEVVPRWQRNLSVGSVFYFLLGAGVLVAASIVVPDFYGTGVSWDLIASAAVSALFAIAAAVMALRGSSGPAIGMATVSALTLYATLTMEAAPRLDQIWVSPREAQMVARHMKQGDPAPVLAGYTEPSALFLIGTETRLASNGRDAAAFSAAQGGLAAVEDGQRPRFLAHLAELEADATPVDALSGFNYSHGRPVHITLFRVTPPHEITSPPQE